MLVALTVNVDAGPDAYQQLLGAGAVPEEILLTHHHHDHMLGLHVLSKAGRLPLHMTKETERGVRTIFPRIDFRVMHLTPGVKLELGDGLVAQDARDDRAGDGELLPRSIHRSAQPSQHRGFRDTSN